MRVNGFPTFIPAFGWAQSKHICVNYQACGPNNTT